MKYWSVFCVEIHRFVNISCLPRCSVYFLLSCCDNYHCQGTLCHLNANICHFWPLRNTDAVPLFIPYWGIATENSGVTRSQNTKCWLDGMFLFFLDNVEHIKVQRCVEMFIVYFARKQNKMLGNGETAVVVY